MLLTSYGQAGTNLKGLQMVKDSNIGSKKGIKSVIFQTTMDWKISTILKAINLHYNYL